MVSKTSTCEDCGNTISTIRAKKCKKCRGIKQRKLNIEDSMSREEYRDYYARNWTMKKKYNITEEDFTVYWIAQHGLCYICKKKMKYPEKRQGQGLDIVAVDHDHKTGKVRSLLCNACNKGLGFFKDDIQLMKEAVKYLEVCEN